MNKPDTIKRLLKFAGKTRREVSNPCITAREAIEIGNYLKDTMRVYRVRGGHGGYEWATICVDGWEVKNGDDTRYVGEILIHSSYGNWAYQWTHMGQPFYQFLATSERDYVASKFMGSDAYEYDGEGTVQEFRKDVLRQRRSDGMSNEYARAVWDFIDENESRMETSERDFVEAVEELHQSLRDEMLGGHLPLPLQYFLSDPYERVMSRLNPAFTNFWKELWPQFINNLQSSAA
mgnify:CR=1 FL=1